MGADWKYGSAAEVMDEIGTVVPFYSGANYQNLAREYGRQWPCTKDRPLGTRSLFAEGLPAQGFKFVPIARPRPAAASRGLSPHAGFRPLALLLEPERADPAQRDAQARVSHPAARLPGGLRGDESRRRQAAWHPRRREDPAAGGGRLGGDRRRGSRPRCAAGRCSCLISCAQVQQQIRGSTENGVQLIPVRVEKEAA